MEQTQRFYTKINCANRTDDLRAKIGFSERGMPVGTLNELKIYFSRKGRA